MFCKRVVVVVLCATLSPTAVALAQEQPSADLLSTTTALPKIGPMQSAIERARFDRGLEVPAERVGDNRPSTTQTSREGSVLGRIVMASVLGVGGFLAGGYLGARIEGPCDCDDPGFKGAIIGAPIGGAVGAIVGWKLGGILSR